MSQESGDPSEDGEREQRVLAEGAQNSRDLAKWAFDLVRNLALIGLVLFLGEVSENKLLTHLGYLLTGLLSYSIASYLQPPATDFLRRRGIKWWRSARSTWLLLLAMLLTAAPIAAGLTQVVEQLAAGYDANRDTDS